MPDPFQKRIRKQTPLQKGPNPETAYSCTLWHDFPGPKPPQKPPKTLPKITKTSPGASPEGTCKTVCKKVIPFSQNYPKSDPGGTPNGSQNPSKITLWSIGDPPAAANRSQRCSGGGKPPKLEPEIIKK